MSDSPRLGESRYFKFVVLGQEPTYVYGSYAAALTFKAHLRSQTIRPIFVEPLTARDREHVARFPREVRVL